MAHRTGLRPPRRLVVAGTWGIKEPAGFGFLGSLADHGTAEFLLTLRTGR
jgi:hypothetical protein